MRNAVMPGLAGIHNEDVDVVHNCTARNDEFDELTNQQQHLR
jgi:hypothetical protein